MLYDICKLSATQEIQHLYPLQSMYVAATCLPAVLDNLDTDDLAP